jgi:hypothetical protein
MSTCGSAVVRLLSVGQSAKATRAYVLHKGGGGPAAL